MSLDCYLIPAYQPDGFEPCAAGMFRLRRDDGFVESLRVYAQSRAKQLSKPLIVSLLGLEEQRLTHDAYDEPLTFLTVDQLDSMHDVNSPMNEGALDYIRNHHNRHGMIVVLYWD